jgi:8-oxo-dGTP pyrophosphatase MutT (NUDIX family)
MVREVITSPHAAGKSPRDGIDAPARDVTDLRIHALEAALASRPPFRAPPDAASSRAAVALLLREREGRLELLLIRRAEREGDPWSGHMALPGGRHQAEDEGMRATAARETREEVGIDPDAGGRLLGELDELAPRSARIPSIVVSPFVWHVPPDVEARPNHEVQEAVWVAVDELLHPDAAAEYLHEPAGGRTLAFPAFDARGYVVWGMTHRILTGFLELYAQAVTP